MTTARELMNPPSLPDSSIEAELQTRDEVSFESGAHPATHGLFTPTMLAGLLAVPVSTVRSWQRRRLIQPVIVVRRIPYFDFGQLAAGRQLVQLVGQGISAASLRQKLDRLARWMPHESLAGLTLSVEGNQIVIRRDGQLIEPGGQRRIDFGRQLFRDEGDDKGATLDVIPIRRLADGLAESRGEVPHADEAATLRRLADQREDAGQIDEAIEAWRRLHLIRGPRADSCYRLGELLYLTGDASGARERYFMALEMDPALVEARASLGCVLLELGENELAIAALRGALEYDSDYPDVHFHLASALELMGDDLEARKHWRRFLELSPLGPWSDEARSRMNDEEDPGLT